MACSRRRSNLILPLQFAILSLIALTLTETGASAQTFTVLHNFTNGNDGSTPWAGLTIDRAGNLYGTTSGFTRASGTVFRLTQRSGTWVFGTLYSFTGGDDGANPETRVVFGPDGSLYGTTTQGGLGSGTVFKLQPRPTACPTTFCPWKERVLYAFGTDGGGDGAYPSGEVTFDRTANIYGVTAEGGAYETGTAYELALSNGTYSHSTIYSFDEYGKNEAYPAGLLSFDSSGNLYGIAAGVLSLDSKVYELVPSPSGWTETTVFNQFTDASGERPTGGVILDASGNLYGAVSFRGANNGGAVYKLSAEGGNWIFDVLFSFQGNGNPSGPASFLYMDSAGNIYGTTYQDGAQNHGSVFKLTPQNGSWLYTSLHDFTGGSDGSEPVSNVVLDSSGNLYGTTSAGGAFGYGVVWEITP